LACVADSTVTFVTLAVAEDARVELAWALMVEAKADPSCSRLIRWVMGVLALKNAAQLAAISFAAELPAAADGDAEAADGDAEMAGADELGDELGAELVPLLPQATRPAPIAQARASWESSL
jgi:hypothetical protein